MLGVVVSPALYVGRQRKEELRLPKSSAARRREAAGSREPPTIRARELDRRRGRLPWRRAATITTKDSRVLLRGLLRTLIPPTLPIFFAALCVVEVPHPLGARWPSCHPLQKETAFAEKEDMENDPDKKSTSASNSDTEMKPEQLPTCVNPGNPVVSCMLDPKTLCTATSLSEPKMIMYKTNSSNYGEFLPMPQFFPCIYTPKEQEFSNHLRATGFYQNNTLNTAPDRTRTLDFPNFQHTL